MTLPVCITNGAIFAWRAKMKLLRDYVFAHAPLPERAGVGGNGAEGGWRERIDCRSCLRERAIRHNFIPSLGMGFSPLGEIDPYIRKCSYNYDAA